MSAVALPITTVPRKLEEFVKQANFTGNKPPHVPFSSLAIPDSPVAAATRAFAEKHLTPAVINHSLRVYYLAAAALKALGNQDPVQLETMYLAAFLHDAGVSPTAAAPGTVAHSLSFEFAGGLIAHSHLTTTNAAAPQIADIMESIMIHTTPSVFESGGCSLTAQLLHLSTAVDVIGHTPGLQQLWDAATVKEIAQAFPRLDFNEQFASGLEDEVTRKPWCLMSQRVPRGFADVIRAYSIST